MFLMLMFLMKLLMHMAITQEPSSVAASQKKVHTSSRSSRTGKTRVAKQPEHSMSSANEDNAREDKVLTDSTCFDVVLTTVPNIKRLTGELFHHCDVLHADV